MIHHKEVSEESILQLNALAILHIDILGEYSLQNKTSRDFFLVIRGIFPLIIKLSRITKIYIFIFFLMKIILEFYKKSDPKKFQFQLEI
jgi:hypothetical protein